MSGVIGEAADDLSALDGRRLLVVGASSGIGRSIALTASASGAQVVLAARRRDLLEAAADQAGDGAVPLVCDVSRPDDCERVVAGAVDALGGLDLLVYSAGVSPLVSLMHADADVWRDVLATNVVGASLVTRAALPALRASSGKAAFLSSSAASRPWPALSVYAASKAALDSLVAGWRAEEPTVGFTRVVVGHTITDFAAGWDPDLAATMFRRWEEAGLLDTGALLYPDEVASRVLAALAAPTDVDALVVRAGESD